MRADRLTNTPVSRGKAPPREAHHPLPTIRDKRIRETRTNKP